MDIISTCLIRLKQSFLEECKKVERLRELESELARSRLRPPIFDPSRLDPSSFESLIDTQEGAFIQNQAGRVREELNACRNDVEERYRPELNPNVAMEWGWMRAMGKRVLFLREKGFTHGRADLVGLRAWNFDWDDPEPGVLTALEEWIGKPA